MIDQDTFATRVRRAVRELEPDATIILYGSRARDEAGSESDWDFLILVDGPVDDKRTDRIRHRLYELEWETGEVISSIVRNRRKWNSRPYKATPLHQHIEREGIRL